MMYLIATRLRIIVYNIPMDHILEVLNVIIHILMAASIDISR